MEQEYTTIKISNEIFERGYKVGIEINGEYYEIKPSKEEIKF